MKMTVSSKLFRADGQYPGLSIRFILSKLLGYNDLKAWVLSLIGGQCRRAVEKNETVVLHKKILCEGLREKDPQLQEDRLEE